VPKRFVVASLPAWTRRPRNVAIGVAVLFVLAAVVTDLPAGSQTQASRLAGARSYVTSVQVLAKSCEAALGEAFTLENLVRSHQATTSQQGSIPALMRDELAACSYTQQALPDMGNLEPPQGPGGAYLQNLTKSVMEWEFPAANETISALSTYLGPPSRASELPTVDKMLAKLSKAAAVVRENELAAERYFKGSLPSIGVMPTRPPGNGTVAAALGANREKRPAPV
jgi:hypothetical protein